MPTIDAEGLLWLFNQYPTGVVPAEALIADAAAHEIEAAHARAALRDLLDAGVLEWAPGAAVRRPQ